MERMTITQVIDEAAELRTWHITPLGDIRAWVGDGEECCPLTCGLRGRTPTRPAIFRSTVRALNIVSYESILYAADGSIGDLPPHQASIRKRMLKAFNLTEGDESYEPSEQEEAEIYP